MQPFSFLQSATQVWCMVWTIAAPWAWNQSDILSSVDFPSAVKIVADGSYNGKLSTPQLALVHHDNSRSDRQATANVKVTVMIKTSSMVSIMALMDHSSRLPQLSTWCISRLLFVTLTLMALRTATVLFIWHEQYHWNYHRQTCQLRSRSPIWEPSDDPKPVAAVISQTVDKVQVQTQSVATKYCRIISQSKYRQVASC